MKESIIYIVKFIRDLILITIAVVGIWWFVSPEAQGAEMTHNVSSHDDLAANTDVHGKCRISSGQGEPSGEWTDPIKCVEWKSIAISAGVLLVGYIITEMMDDTKFTIDTEQSSNVPRFDFNTKDGKAMVEYRIPFDL